MNPRVLWRDWRSSGIPEIGDYIAARVVTQTGKNRIVSGLVSHTNRRHRAFAIASRDAPETELLMIKEWRIGILPEVATRVRNKDV